MGLGRYNKKRNFNISSEPRGPKKPLTKNSDKKKSSKTLSFVIQKHAARRLHYDLRLELDGVLLSWAVPKGPSYDPTQKRLAVHVEDHPLDYATFEGSIPKGEYGGGEVIVWDNGTWQPISDPKKDLKKGRLEFHLKGKKLNGVWVLVRMGPPQEVGKENWLLIKRTDAYARSETDFSVTEQKPKSVISRKTIEDLQKKTLKTNQKRKRYYV